MASPGIVIPLLVLLVLIIYYLISLTGALREANNDLKVSLDDNPIDLTFSCFSLLIKISFSNDHQIQLRRERTEERRKMFKIAGGKKEKETPFNKWKMIIPAAKQAANPDEAAEPKPSVLTTGKQTGFAGTKCAMFVILENARTVHQTYLGTGAAKRAALKAKKLQEQQQQKQQHDDGNATDLDQVSLPDDQPQRGYKPIPPRKPSCTDSIASTRSEIPVIKISKDEDNKVGTSRTMATAPGSSRNEPGPSTGVDPNKKARVMKALISAAKVS